MQYLPFNRDNPNLMKEGSDLRWSEWGQTWILGSSRVVPGKGSAEIGVETI